MPRHRFIPIWILSLLLWATPALAGTLTLAWDPSPDPAVTGYVVAFGTQPGVHPTTVDVGNTTVSQIHSLLDGQKYYFVVSAYTSFGVTSAPSSEVSGTVLSVVTLVSNQSSPTPSGVPLTWTAFGPEGLVLEYEFWRFSQATGAWTIVQNYSAASSFTWTPATTETGTYAMQVWVRLAGSTASLMAYRSSNSFTIADGGINVGALEADAALPASTGTKITWTAQAVGGPAPLQYQFWRFSQSSGAWTMVRDYTTDNTFSWTPASTDQGQYALQVWVRGNGSTASKNAWRATGFFGIENGPVTVASLTANTALPAGTGAAITWTADAVGPGPLEYQFWRFSQSTGKWTSVQAYGPSNTFTWTPTAGTYSLQVWVRRQGTTVVYDAFGASGSFQIADGTPKITSMTANRGPQLGTGLPVTWHVAATGGPGGLQYRFWLYNQAAESWAIVQDYSANSDFTWTPHDAGTYAVQVGVRRSTSSAAYEVAGSSGFFTVLDALPTVQPLTSSAGSTVSVGMPTTWTAISGGGPGPLEYEFWGLNQTTQTWTLLQGYSWSNSFAWVPLSGDQGTYLIQVWVRRTGSTAAFEGWSNSPQLVVK